MSLDSSFRLVEKGMTMTMVRIGVVCYKVAFLRSSSVVLLLLARYASQRSGSPVAKTEAILDGVNRGHFRPQSILNEKEHDEKHEFHLGHTNDENQKPEPSVYYIHHHCIVL